MGTSLRINYSYDYGENYAPPDVEKPAADETLYFYALLEAESSSDFEGLWWTVAFVYVTAWEV